MYGEALAWLEASALGEIARHSPWLFTVSNVLHVLGAALTVGAIAVLDLRILLGRDVGAWDTGRWAVPVAAAGLALQVPTGLVLLAVEARALGVNPAFYAKLALIALGLANVAAFHLLYARSARAGLMPRGARRTAVISLGSWIGALVAGRMIAYL